MRGLAGLGNSLRSLPGIRQHAHDRTGSGATPVLATYGVGAGGYPPAPPRPGGGG
jgi:hypothetical protein